MFDDLQAIEAQLGDNWASQELAAPQKRPGGKLKGKASNMFGGSIVDYGRLMAGAGSAAQYAQLSGMANDAMSAIRNENASRVAQAREARRMQHEKDLLLTRLRGMNQQQPFGQMTPQQVAALEVLRQEEEGGRTGTVRSNALRTLGML